MSRGAGVGVISKLTKALGATAPVERATHFASAAAACALPPPPMKRARDSADDAPEPLLPNLEALSDARRAYNVGICKSAEVAGVDWKTAMAQGEDVNRKTKEFCSCFARSIRANDVTSGKPILQDYQQFEARYRTVFRESSKGLQMQVLC